MLRLLRADFKNMFKFKTLYICLLCLLGYVALMFWSLYRMDSSGCLTLDVNIAMNFFPMLGLVSIIICSAFVGTDYSDGTLRNKLVVGHTRVSIYLSKFITCSVATIICFIIPLLTGIGAGFILFDDVSYDFGASVLYYLFGILLCISFSALFTCLSMLDSNKANAAIISFVLAFVLMMVGAGVHQSLSEPEYYEDIPVMNEQGELEIVDHLKNEYYITGTKRSIYELIDNCLPMGQILQTMNMNMEKPELVTGYVVLWIVVFTAGGCAAFRRKRIK